MPETHQTFCRICEALCGLTVTVEDGQVTHVRPDAEHVTTDGFACVKGLKQHRLYSAPDRLLRPRRRDGDAWEDVSWDDAYAGIGAKVKQLLGDHGPDSIAMYVGTAAGFSALHPVFAQGFMTGVGSRSMYASATQDCSNKFAVAAQVYGFPFLQPFPDIDRVDCLIVVGANPVISKWSFLQVPNPAKRLKALTERGGKLFFIDPRKTESAKVAGEHLFIRPGSDVYFYLSFLHEVLERGAFDRARVEEHMKGFADLAGVVEGWAPERTAPATGIPADDLRRLVDAYVGADGAALYCSTGVNMGGQGALAFWLQEVINAVTGNLDRRGGTLVGKGIFDFPGFGKKNGTLLRTDRSRVGDIPSVNDAFAGALLPDEILTPGPGQVKALFVTGGNPLLTMADSGRMREALSQLELVVVLDILPTETAELAHYVLPCTTPLERPDLPFIFPTALGMQARPYMQATKAVLPPRGEVRDEATIYAQLARACGTPLFGSALFQRLLEGAMRVKGVVDGDGPAVPQERLLDLILRLGRQPGFGSMVRKHPHGRLRPDHAGEDFLGQRVVTDDGLVDLAPAPLVEAASKLEDHFRELQRDRRRLRMITRRQVTTHNSWTHNLEDWVGGERGTNYLYVHPDDLRERGLTEGELVDVSSATATVRLPVRAHAELMPGTVALPHGWGHQKARGLSVASRTRGVNANLLAASGPDAIDPLSGMAKLTALEVDVRKAEGPQDQSDWSGLPAEL
jgi:anaerobic selenocysteine-containing dehydrogenase